MRITTKFLLAFLVISVSFLIVFFYMMNGMLVASVDEIEEMEVEHDSVIVSSALGKLNEELRLHTLDYGAWDEMADFVKTQDAEWARANIEEWAMGAYDLDMVEIYNSDGEEIYEFGEKGEFSAEMVRVRTLERVREKTSVNGFINLNGRIMEYAASLITTSETGISPEHYLVLDESIPVSGVYVAARYLDERTTRELAKITGLDVEIISQGDLTPEEFSHSLTFPSVVEGDKITYYRPIADFERQPIGFIRFTELRRVSQLTRDNILNISYLFTVMNFVFMAILAVAVWIMISRPMARLARNIGRIDVETYEPLKYAKRSDEFGIVARSFNKLMGAMHKHQDEISAGKKELEVKNKEIAARLETIDKMNKFMVGREVAMDKLKKQMAKYEALLKKNKIQPPEDEKT